jgi:hypothetical protein
VKRGLKVASVSLAMQDAELHRALYSDLASLPSRRGSSIARSSDAANSRAQGEAAAAAGGRAAGSGGAAGSNSSAQSASGGSVASLAGGAATTSSSFTAFSACGLNDSDQRMSLLVALATLPSDDDRKAFILEHFIEDVVYSEQRLCDACGIPGGGGPGAPTREWRRSQLECCFNNATGRLDFCTKLKPYVICNMRNRCFELVTGVTNQDIVSYLMPSMADSAASVCAPASSSASSVRAAVPPGAVHGVDGVPATVPAVGAMIRNWFELLRPDGNTASDADVSALYRGSFTPEFYPRRFAAKDAIY